MSENITVRDAILRDLESAEAALKGANKSYADAERNLRDAQQRASHAYDGRAMNQQNVDRLRKALAIIEGDTDA